MFVACPNLDCFLRAVTRRMAVVRLLERTGIAVCASSGIALAWIAYALCTGRLALPIALVVLALGAVTGITWSLMRRPTRLQVALDADRQLELSDLLSTAFLLLKPNIATAMDAGYRIAILAQAEARCRDAELRRLVLHRIGSRGWTGVALTVALVVALASFSGPSSKPSPEQASTQTQFASLQSRDAISHPLLDLTSPADRRPVTPGDPDDPNASQFGQNPADQARGKTERRTTTDDDSQGKSAPVRDGQGGGAARTEIHDKPNSQLPIREATTADQPALNSTGTPTAGSGAASKTGTSQSESSGASGTLARSAQKSSPAPPWQSSAWPAEVQRAKRNMDAGHVPSAYRDLVRGYFSEDLAE